ncbi:hypothetical protein M7I_6921 [Glarea lozoyensis 74030]|uniref:Uncharacterized protein n=1 Tax=Glarea lozoyensis (strain ATCC 74030 / MF5533) TaxID=1104152 RepID=H0EVW4_GLAL7|nr:hypothetical protein M7I_6921 [Glarea lozoyensis 74030]
MSLINVPAAIHGESPLANDIHNDYLENPILFAENPEHWTRSLESYELQMMETPLDPFASPNFEVYDLVLDEAHLERQKQIAHEEARRGLRRLNEDQKIQKQYAREEADKLNKVREKDDPDFERRAALQNRHESWKRPSPIEQEEVAKPKDDQMADGRRLADFYPLDQLKRRVLRPMLEERVKATSDEKEIRQKMRTSSSPIVSIPEHVSRYLERQTARANYEAFMERDECERIKREIRRSVERKFLEMEAKEETYAVGKEKIYPTTQEYIEALEIAKSEFASLQERSLEDISNEIPLYRARIEEQDPRSGILSQITEASHESSHESNQGPTHELSVLPAFNKLSLDNPTYEGGNNHDGFPEQHHDEDHGVDAHSGACPLEHDNSQRPEFLGPLDM